MHINEMYSESIKMKQEIAQLRKDIVQLATKHIDKSILKKNEQLDKLELLLFIKCDSNTSKNAIEVLNKFVWKYFDKSKCDLKVIDILQEPELVEKYKVIAAPTLIKLEPLPVQRFIGEFINEDYILLKVLSKI